MSERRLLLQNVHLFNLKALQEIKIKRLNAHSSPELLGKGNLEFLPDCFRGKEVANQDDDREEKHS